MRFILLLALFLPMSAHASLYDRGGGLIYDDELKVTWLQDANYALTTGYATSTGGAMTWVDATAWAANLSYYDSVRNVTYTDWRLPTVPLRDETCSLHGSETFGANCIGSEMGHLFYSDLGGVFPNSVTNSPDPDVTLFMHLMSGTYWTGTEYPLNNSYAWNFFMQSGYQDYYAKQNHLYAWAVRDGDVSTVPLPPTYLLLITGLALVGFMARHRKQE